MNKIIELMLWPAYVNTIVVHRVVVGVMDSVQWVRTRV